MYREKSDIFASRLGEIKQKVSFSMIFKGFYENLLFFTGIRQLPAGARSVAEVLWALLAHF